MGPITRAVPSPGDFEQETGSPGKIPGRLAFPAAGKLRLADLYRGEERYTIVGELVPIEPEVRPAEPEYRAGIHG
jgi:hypothetical protein